MTGSTGSFDPTDLKYQADEKFLPDKEQLWQHPPDHDGWVHAHNTIRGELATTEDCLVAIEKQAKSGDPSTVCLKEWQVQALQSMFDVHHHFVHSHHTNEDDILAPALAKRIKYPDKLTSDHEGIVQALASLKTAMNKLKAGDDAQQSMANTIQQWKAYRTDMEEHLLEEEQIGLPLARAYFTPREYQAIVRKIIAKENDQLSRGSFVHYMGKDRMRTEFMKENGIPFFVWHLVFRGALKAYNQKIVSMAEALQSGVEPIPQRRGLLGCQPVVG